MVYIKHDFTVPRELWNKWLLAKTASMFSKKMLNYFYNPDEIVKRCVSEGEHVRTPNRRNKPRAISPNKSDAIESKIYKSMLLKGTI